MATGTLTGQTIANTYKSLLRVGTGSTADNTLLDADLQIIEDGDGTNSCLQLSTDAFLIKNATGTDVASTFEVQDKDGTVCLSVNGTNNRVGIGTTAPLDNFHVAGDDDTDAALIVTSYDTDSPGNPPSLRLFRARGTQASPSIVGDNDVLGSIWFGGFIGSNGDYYTNYDIGAGILARVDGDPSNADDDLPTELAFYTNDDGATDHGQRMVIDPGGNVGIGTTDPAVPFHVSSASDNGSEILAKFSEATPHGRVDIGLASGDAYLTAYSTGGGVMAQIHSDGDSYFNGGNVGIGESVPDALLHLKSAAPWIDIEDTGYSDERVKIGTDANNMYLMCTDAAGAFYFKNDIAVTSNPASAATYLMAILGNGKVGIGTHTPNADLHVDGEFILGTDGAPDSVPIVSGACTTTKAYNEIIAEGDAADNLDTISGGVRGQIIMISPENGSENITIRDNATGGGNIDTGVGNPSIVMGDRGDITVLLFGHNSRWKVIASHGTGWDGM